MPKLYTFNYPIPAYVKICKRGRPAGNPNFGLSGPARPPSGTQVGQGTLLSQYATGNQARYTIPYRMG
ncbi:hypothetical protein M3B46_18610 [Sphingobacterium daejeonense]|uniref:hypothetical protein n=1 Tax=Sphingobacterium daejeonense TaxID=371142 RepID=UPI0021A3CC28|nr:hypothetical protein [Sphingobacterium daejeonense]MCT1533020.1 hypothetical protein [Sphingobacterium daejeonense]